MPIQSAIFQKYGTAEGKSRGDAGMYCTYGPTQVLEWDITLSQLDQNENVQNDVLIVPDNCMLEKVEVVTLVAAATGTAIDVGLIHISRNASDAEFTALPQGILSAFATASMDTVGQYVSFVESGSEDTAVVTGTTTAAEGGDLIGDVIVAPCLLTASRTDATAYTAGRILLRLHVRPAALSA
jgi:hypothetical protein